MPRSSNSIIGKYSGLMKKFFHVREPLIPVRSWVGALAPVAQLVEHSFSKREVSGSKPDGSFWFYRIMVSTQDSDSCNASSILAGTWPCGIIG